MKGLSEEVREIMKEYIGDNSVAGVTVLARGCTVTPDSLTMGEPVPVCL